jgi:hypothetical protein
LPDGESEIFLQVGLDRPNHVEIIAENRASAQICDLQIFSQIIRSGPKNGGGASALRIIQDIDIWPGFSFEAPAATSNVDIAAECLHHTLLNRLAERCERFRQVVPGKFSVMSDASPSGWPLQI